MSFVLPWRRRLVSAILRSVVVPAFLLTSVDCGYSEEQWQAMLKKQEELERRCPRGEDPIPFPSAPTVQGCGKDVDCKGERVCELGRCVSPHPLP
jgi:hypothetical protein